VNAVLDWFTDPAMWSGAGGIPTRVLEHLWYSTIAVLVAAVIALPLGVLTGHARGGGGLPATALATYWRAVPTLGVVVLVFQIEPLSVWPVLAALVVIAVPPILLNTQAGLRSVEPTARDAALGMGMTELQLLRRVDVPLAGPVLLGGVRSATAQVIATATVAAFVGLGGLGRYIIDGYASRDLVQVTGGAVLIAALALAVDGVFALLQRAVQPATRRRHHLPGYLLGAVTHPKEKL
jgi:osmoprotectant transport system permease protein